MRFTAVRNIISVLCVAMVLYASPALAAGPQDTVAAFNDALLQTMRNGPQLGFDGRYELLAPAYEAAFAWKSMARFAAGSHWSTMTGDDRQAYLDAYRAWSVSTYADRFKEYKGQKFEVLAPEESGRSAQVVSRLTKSGGKTVDLIYKLRPKGEDWYVVDIQVRGVSQLALTRSQFIGVLDKEGLPALLQQLRDKTAAMSPDISS